MRSYPRDSDRAGGGHVHMLMRVSDGGWMAPTRGSSFVASQSLAFITTRTRTGTLKSGVSQNSTWSPDWKIGEKGETKNPPKKEFSAWHLICHTSWFWKDSEPKCTESLA